MSYPDLANRLNQAVSKLSAQESLKGLFHQHRDGDPLPSGDKLKEIIDLSLSTNI